MSLQRIESKRKSTKVVEQIADAIRRGVYRVGNRLPSERVIAELTGVSRPVVREALSALQLAGVLDSRPGDGTYVVRSPDEVGNYAATLLEEAESPVEALEARRVLEQAVVALAVFRMTEDALQAIRHALEQMRDGASHVDFQVFNEGNMAFHIAIARATGNSLIENAIRPLLSIMGQRLAVELRRRDYDRDRAFFAEAYRVHEVLYDAMALHDAQQAAVAMGRHFDMIEAALRRD